MSREIHPADLIREVSGSDRGAVALFLGTVRDVNDGRPVASLSYAAYEEMALAELERILDEMAANYGASHTVIEHRIGALAVGDVSVGIAVAHRHRGPAIAAMTYGIEELKRRVPIWKEEHYADGTREWVNPASAPVPA